MGGILRSENIDINNLTFGKNGFGEQTTTQAKWFTTRAIVGDVANSLKINEKYRLYQDMVNFTLNFTPNTKLMANRQELYSITYRGYDWRITDARETNDRMKIKFLCYRTEPITAV